MIVRIELNSGMYSQRHIWAEAQNIKPLPDGSLVFRDADVRDYKGDVIKGFKAGAVNASEIKATHIIHA